MKTSTGKNSFSKNFFCKKDYDKVQHQKDLTKIDWSSLYTFEDINQMYDFFVEKVYKVIILNAPIKTVFIRNDKPKTLKTDDQIRKLFNAETNEANKWKIINNTNNLP